MSVDGILRAVGAWDLPGQTTRVAGPVPCVVDDWSLLLRAISDERLEGTFASMIAAGGIDVAGWQAAEAERAHVEAMALAVRIDDVVRRVAEVFDASHVPMRLLKGAATAHLDHVDPALRSYGDADILVPTGRYELACDLLQRVGLQRRSPEFTRGFDSRFAKSVTFISDDGLEVDLHRTIVYGPFSVGIPEADLWEPGPSIDIGGASVEALEINRRFLHACVHTAVGSAIPRLTSLRDVVVIGSGAIAPQEIASIATRWRIEPVVVRAASLARSYFGLELDWVGELLPVRERDFRLRCSLDERSPWASATVGLLVTLPSWSDRAALARMLSASLRTSRERSPGSRARKFVSAGWRTAAGSTLARPRGALSLR